MVIKRGLTEDEIADSVIRRMRAITQSHAFTWSGSTGPSSDGTGRVAAPDTPVDFDINTKGTIESPFLALVPDQADRK